MCYIKLKEWADATRACNNVLEMESEEASNIKALYRRGLARIHLGLYKEAKADYINMQEVKLYNKWEITPDNEYVTNSTDYLEANLTILGTFETFFSPAFVTWAITAAQTHYDQPNRENEAFYLNSFRFV